MNHTSPIQQGTVRFPSLSALPLAVLLGAACFLTASAGADPLPGTPGVMETINGTGGATSGVALTYDIPLSNWPSTIYLEARGADGGHASAGPTNNPENFLGEGGGGATMGITFQVDPTAANALRPGGQLRFLVGNRGESYAGGSGGAVGAGGGGGGTGILYLPPGGSTADPVKLVIAGGGGGGFVDSFLLTPLTPANGVNASTGENGTATSGGGAYNGTTGGAGANVGGGGATFLSGGGGGFTETDWTTARIAGTGSGWLGGNGGGGVPSTLRRGGWGSGGGGAAGSPSDSSKRPAGGGGGGYSGGDGGQNGDGGGGGGSFALGDWAVPGPLVFQTNSGSGRQHGRVRYQLGALVNQTIAAPVVTLNGPAYQEIPLFGTYTEQGATAVNGYGPLSVVTTGSVNTSVLGDQTVTYTATDEWGRSDTKTRTVHISQLPTQRLYVDKDATGAANGSSWANAFVHLQDALDAVTPPAIFEIWVAEGTYRPDQGTARTPGDTGASFRMISDTAIYGGFGGTETLREQRDPVLHPTILSGDLNSSGGPNSGDSVHVVIAENVNAGGILDGFTITSGYAVNNSTSDGTSRRGGGARMNGSSCLIQDCVFLNNRASTYGGGVAILSACPGARFVRCHFEGNASNWGGSAFAAAASAPDPSADTPLQVIDSVFVANTQPAFGGAGGAIYVFDHAADFYNALVTGNSGVAGAGIRIEALEPTEVRIINTTVAGNLGGSYYGGMRVGGYCHLTLANSIIWGNDSSNASQQNDSLQLFSLDVPATFIHNLIEHFDNAGLGGVGNLDGTSAANDPRFLDPLFASAAPTTGGNYRIAADSPAVNAGDNDANPLAGFVDSVDLAGNPRISGAIIDLGAYETQAPIYVDASAGGFNNGRSWLDAFTDLQDALAAVRDGGEIHVATGTYKPGTATTDTFRIPAGLRLYGGYPSGGGSFASRDPEAQPVVLSGDIGTPGLWTDNVKTVVTVDDQLASLAEVLLDGVVVRDGYTIAVGAGIVCRENLTLRMCRIEHNHAGDSGGGVFVYPSSTLTVEDSVIFDNEALGGGGGVALSGGLSGAWLTARNTAWEQNRANSTLGGALYCFNSTATLVDCRLAGNDAWNGGAVYASDTNLTMVNALVTGNRATAGVPATGRGGGVYATGSGTMTLVNGTFSGNLSAEGGGAIHAGMFLLEMSNCVAWNNSALGSTAHPNASIGGVTTFLLNIRNNLMQNLDLTSDGPGNFDGTLASNDPLFATPLSPASAPSTLGDFHLQSTSPILHAGDNAAVSEATDLDGNPRILGPAVDLGAYERAGIVYVDASATGTGDGLSWPDAFTTLQAALAFVAGSGVHDEIWIAEGTYVPNPYDFGGGPQGFAVGVSVSLRGGFPTGGSGLDGRDFVAHPTVLDATGTNGRVFTINDGNDAVERVVLFDGLVVRGGTAYEDGISPVGQARGGGIYCRENLTLRDVSLTNNTADFLGGGICLDHGSATIEACTIRDNTASGRSISAAIGYAGGGIYAEAGTVLDLTDSEILSNQTVYSNARGAGVCVLAGSTLSAERCRFAGNHGKDRGGAIYAYQATLAFDTCAFTGNTGWEGGAIYQDQLVSCSHVNGTFAGNGAVLTTNGTGDGGAIVVNGTSATFLNTLVWGNQSALAPDTATASILVRNGGSFTADHCLAQHLDLVGHGSGNIDGTLPGHDPLMVAPLDPAAAPSETGDFRLNIGSMCLDSGDASASNSATDLAGGPRIVSSEIDMGAYEGPLSVRTDVHLFRPDFDSDFLNVANWQSAGTPTPAAMVTGHFYIVLGDANLNASSSLSGVLRIDPAVQLTVGAGGGLVVTGAGSLLVSGTLANTPEITVSGSSSLDLAGGTLTGPVFSLGTSRVSGSGTLGGVVVFEGGDIKGSGTLTVSGLLRTSGAGATSIEGPLLLDNSVPDARVLQIDPGSTLQNAGGVTFQSGEAMVRGTWQHNQTLLEVLAGATLSGDGTVSGGNVDVYGRAEPGPDTGYGDLHIQGGGFTHYNGATTRIEVGGNGAGEFDRILVTGQAALGGTLLVDFAERPLAEPGSYVFLVPTSGYMFGYATRTPVDLAPTRGFSYTYGSASDRFTITSTGSPYQDWAFASGLTAGVNDDPFFDANDDGVPNIQHYAYDTDPLGGGGTEGKQRTSIVENGGIHYFALTLPIRRGAVFSGTPSPTAGIDGVFVTIQGSLDLQTWDELVFPLLPADSAGLPPLRDIDGDGTAEWEYRTFIFYDHLPPKRFLRAKTELAPP